jgi:hypothetical protein
MKTFCGTPNFVRGKKTEYKSSFEDIFASIMFLLKPSDRLAQQMPRHGFMIAMQFKI